MSVVAAPSPRHAVQTAATIFFAGSLVASGAAGAATLCHADEQVIFSCPTGAARILSLCASKDLSKNAGYLQYRFGPAGKPALVFPETQRHPAGIFTPGSLMFSGGGGDYLRFTKTPYTYTVFSAFGNWGKKGAKMTVEGVAVEKDGGGEVANIPCRNDFGSSGDGLGPQLFERAGLGDPQSDFDIPEAFFPK